MIRKKTRFRLKKPVPALVPAKTIIAGTKNSNNIRQKNIKVLYLRLYLKYDHKIMFLNF